MVRTSYCLQCSVRTDTALHSDHWKLLLSRKFLPLHHLLRLYQRVSSAKRKNMESWNDGAHWRGEGWKADISIGKISFWFSDQSVDTFQARNRAYAISARHMYTNAPVICDRQSNDTSDPIQSVCISSIKLGVFLYIGVIRPIGRKLPKRTILLCPRLGIAVSAGSPHVVDLSGIPSTPFQS